MTCEQIFSNHKWESVYRLEKITEPCDLHYRCVVWCHVLPICQKIRLHLIVFPHACVHYVYVRFNRVYSRSQTLSPYQWYKCTVVVLEWLKLNITFSNSLIEIKQNNWYYQILVIKNENCNVYITKMPWLPVSGCTWLHYDKLIYYGN